jgi:hypothetical protein
LANSARVPSIASQHSQIISCPNSSRGAGDQRASWREQASRACAPARPKNEGVANVDSGMHAAIILLGWRRRTFPLTHCVNVLAREPLGRGRSGGSSRSALASPAQPRWNPPFQMGHAEPVHRCTGYALRASDADSELAKRRWQTAGVDFLASRGNPSLCSVPARDEDREGQESSAAKTCGDRLLWRIHNGTPARAVQVNSPGPNYGALHRDRCLPLATASPCGMATC